MSDKKTQAHALIEDFRKHGPKQAAFTKIQRDAVIDGLGERIDSPYKINQGDSSLCGPAAILFEAATDDPAAYAQFVLDLYAKGEGKIEKLDVRPSAELKSYALPATRTSPNAADWIPLASLRDSSNWIMRYQAVGDQVSGITMPASLAQWARDMGYTKVIDNTFQPEWDGTKNLWEAALRSEVDGYHVFLLINAALLDEHPTTGWVSYPDHWVALISAIVAENGDAKLQVYTWGEKRLVPPLGGVIPAAVIRMHYFGFVAAKY